MAQFVARDDCENPDSAIEDNYHYKYQMMI